MRLKPAGILAVLAIIAVLAYFALKPRLSNQGKQDTTEISTKPSIPESDSSTEKKTGSSTADTKSEDRAFNYSPEKPVNGTLRAVVELGASGFNSFVINMDNQKRWEIISKDFGESLAYEGLATTDDIKAGLKKYISGMFDKGVSNNNIHFVIS